MVGRRSPANRSEPSWPFPRHAPERQGPTWTTAALALLLDRWLGEPPNGLHPVAWLGRWLADLEVRVRRWMPASRLGQGAAGGLALAGGMLPALLLARTVGRRGGWLAGLALKQALAHRALDRAVAQVEAALRGGMLDQARNHLGHHLVSRDTRELSPEEVAMAAVESLAENLNDSLVAPLFWWAVAGLPGAWGYRAVNTADAMWGYRCPRYEWFGKPAARLDDLLNWVPARLTAALIWGVAACQGVGSRTWRTWRRESGRTPSPNAGHPMAAMAGALGVSLSKPGVYTLHGGPEPCTVEHVAQARKLARRAAWLAWGIVLLATLLWREPGPRGSSDARRWSMM